jgi:hypothetical protein
LLGLHLHLFSSQLSWRKTIFIFTMVALWMHFDWKQIWSL